MSAIPKISKEDIEQLVVYLFKEGREKAERARERWIFVAATTASRPATAPLSRLFKSPTGWPSSSFLREMKMSRPIVGQRVGEKVTRDAIHIPIIPATAVCVLIPGEKIEVFSEEDVSSPEGKRIYAKPSLNLGKESGVVDPFLLNDVKAGERFYCFVRPEKVKKLWHEWESASVPKETK